MAERLIAAEVPQAVPSRTAPQHIHPLARNPRPDDRFLPDAVAARDAVGACRTVETRGDTSCQPFQRIDRVLARSAPPALAEGRRLRARRYLGP
eukprot:3766711-Rhodomonas_salina.1